jgi:hypothetical protein
MGGHNPHTELAYRNYCSLPSVSHASNQILFVRQTQDTFLSRQFFELLTHQLFIISRLYVFRAIIV